MEDVLGVSLNPGLWKFPALLRKRGMFYFSWLSSDRRGVVNKSKSQLSPRMYVRCVRFK